MATYCLQCNAKIGLFKKPIEGIYCSAACRDSAAEEQARREEQARARAQEQARLAAEAAERAALEPAQPTGGSPVPSAPPPQSIAPASSAPPASEPPAWERSHSGVVSRAPSATEPCPKCASPWNQIPGGGALGRNRGDCPWCGYSAEYLTIETCDNCRCRSVIVVGADDARCAKCKSRPRRRRSA